MHIIVHYSFFYDKLYIMFENLVKSEKMAYWEIF